MLNHSVLIIGVFNRKNKEPRNYTSAAEQLADLFRKHKLEIITTSFFRNKILRLADTLYTIILNKRKFEIAILPVYGTPLSFFWQEISARLLQLYGKKIILIVHGGSIPGRMQQNARPFLRAFKRAKLIICPSRYLQDVLATYQVTSIVIENVLNLSNYSFFAKQEIRPRLIWMRAFEGVYNPLMAVRVAGILQKKIPGFRMVMAGSDRGMLAEIKSVIAKMNLENSVLLPGYLTLEAKLEYARECDIYINTNHIDNAPVSLIEFMALGLPVVSVNTGGIPFLIENESTGLLVDDDDEEAMVEKIEFLLEHQEFAKKMALKAYEFSRHFDEINVWHKWTGVLMNF